MNIAVVGALITGNVELEQDHEVGRHCAGNLECDKRVIESQSFRLDRTLTTNNKPMSMPKNPQAEKQMRWCCIWPRIVSIWSIYEWEFYWDLQYN